MRRMPNFNPRLHPEHKNRNPEFERRADRLPQTKDKRTMSIRKPISCPLCGREYLFDVGWRRVDCKCGCTFFAPTSIKPDAGLRNNARERARADKEEKMRR